MKDREDKWYKKAFFVHLQVFALIIKAPALLKNTPCFWLNYMSSASLQDN